MHLTQLSMPSHAAGTAFDLLDLMFGRDSVPGVLPVCCELLRPETGALTEVRLQALQSEC